MLDIRFVGEGEVALSGRFDASQENHAYEFLDQVHGRCTLDFSELEYISSSGLGVLLATQKRLMGEGGGLRIINAGKHIRDIFMYSGLSRVFEIEDPGSPT